MTQRETRRKERLNSIQVKKLSLHEDQHNNFHIGLSLSQSWELLSKISKESWLLETGKKAPDKLDKNIINIVSKESICT